MEMESELTPFQAIDLFVFIFDRVKREDFNSISGVSFSGYYQYGRTTSGCTKAQCTQWVILSLLSSKSSHKEHAIKFMDAKVPAWRNLTYFDKIVSETNGDKT
jgi:hypothetical protein